MGCFLFIDLNQSLSFDCNIYICAVTFSIQPFHTVSTWNFLMVLYVLLFSAYGIFSIATFITNMKDAMQSKFIFEDKLGISVRKLEGGAVEWHEIVRKILELQQSGEYRVAIHGQDIKDELVVAQRIMRRENFMISFFNQDLLDLTIPVPWKGGRRFRTKFYSKSIEWSIYYCVLSYMFNHKYQIRPAFCMDAASLQRRFICVVLLMLSSCHFCFSS
jgi:Autophagy protein Apg9.